MTAKIIVNTLLIIMLAVAHISFISSLPAPFNHLNLVLVILIFILGFLGFNLAIWWSLGVGLMIEIFFFLPFGAYLASLILAVVIADLLLNYFFTNRSLYSFLALVALATLANELIINYLSLIFREANKFFFLAELNYWFSTLKQIGLNLLLAIFVYYLIYFFSRNLKPVFLIKSKRDY